MYDGFVFYSSFYDALMDLPDDVRLQAYDAVCKYGICGEEPEFSGVVRTVFKLIKPQIDANRKRREAGRKGGEANAKQYASKPDAPQKQIEAKDKDKVKDKVKVKDKDKVKVKVNVKDIEEYGITEPVLKELDSFIEHRRAIKKPMTENAVTLLVKKLYRMGETDEERISLLDEAIVQGWQSIYPQRESPPRLKPKKNAFANFPQRDYNEDDLESFLLEGVRR